MESTVWAGTRGTAAWKQGGKGSPCQLTLPLHPAPGSLCPRGSCRSPAPGTPEDTPVPRPSPPVPAETSFSLFLPPALHTGSQAQKPQAESDPNGLLSLEPQNHLPEEPCNWDQIL